MAMRAIVTAALFFLTAFPASATDDDERLFDTAYSEYMSAFAAGKTALDLGSKLFEPGDPQLSELKHNYGPASRLRSS